MSQFLDKLRFFKLDKQSFSQQHGVTSNENREWEQAYRRAA